MLVLQLFSRLGKQEYKTEETRDEHMSPALGS